MSDESENGWGVARDAAELHRAAMVWDNHAGFAYQRASDLEEVSRWARSGVDYLSLNAGYDVMPWTLAVEALSQYRHWVRAHGDMMVEVDTVEDVHRAKRESKIAVAYDLEGMDALNGDVGMVDVYYKLGVRQMLFAYNRNNLAGSGCHDEDIGLTPFGRDVIREMNRVGMVVDCSHTGYRTSMEAMEESAAPVIFSHSNARRLCDHERNIHDDQILACAATGGVVGVTGVGCFLGPEGATVAHLVEHIDHMVSLVGPEHVGIGLDAVLEDEEPVSDLSHHRDYWPESQYPSENLSSSGYIPPEALPQVTEKLLERGYKDWDVRAILGENFLRIASRVWQRA